MALDLTQGVGGFRGRRAGQTLESSFSAVAMPNVAKKASSESSRRDLHNIHDSTDLRSQMFDEKLSKRLQVF